MSMKKIRLKNSEKYALSKSKREHRMLDGIGVLEDSYSIHDFCVLFLSDHKMSIAYQCTCPISRTASVVAITHDAVDRQSNPPCHRSVCFCAARHGIHLDLLSTPHHANL